MADVNAPERERRIELDPSWEMITRGDVLFILDTLFEHSSRAIAGNHEAGMPAERQDFVIANHASLIRAELRNHWGIDG
jgi:hypothetical protein